MNLDTKARADSPATFAAIHEETQADARAILRGDSAHEIATADFCEDTDTFADWLAGSDLSIREPSAYFGPISTQELFSKFIFGSIKANAEQKAAACNLLRKRFTTEYAERIAKKAEALRAEV